MPGALAQRVEFSAPLNLTKNRILAVQLEVEGAEKTTGESPVLNIQLDSGGKVYRDYYIDLDFRGSKTVILSEPGTQYTLDAVQSREWYKMPDKVSRGASRRDQFVKRY
jgi:hypothetical protein